jgi:hypothetical protein
LLDAAMNHCDFSEILCRENALKKMPTASHAESTARMLWIMRTYIAATLRVGSVTLKKEGLVAVDAGCQ